MTAPEPTPTAEHIDAVARVLALAEGITPGTDVWHSNTARRILTSTDPAVHLAMLDALVRAGVLTAGQAKFGALPIRPGDSFSGRAG